MLKENKERIKVMLDIAKKKAKEHKDSLENNAGVKIERAIELYAKAVKEVEVCEMLLKGK